MIWASIASWWSNSKTAQWITAALLFLIGAKAVMESIKHAAKKAERQANAQRNAEEYARTVQTSSQVKDEIRHDRDQAIAAGDAQRPVSSVDELRQSSPEIASVLIRRGD
jgi:flagellar biosynthesis/type III secretory pathway M-ring protein FliF/YscJ